MKGTAESDWQGMLEPRRPVPRWRRWAGVVVLLGVLAGVLAYQRLTDPDRLREYAQQWLKELSGGEVLIDQVRLDWREGLHLVGVTVATPASEPFDPRDNSLAGRTVFRAEAVFLRLRPLSVITGRLVVQEVVAIQPRLTLGRRMTDGRWNWEGLLQGRRVRRGGEVGRWPVIRLRGAEVVQERIDERGRARGQPVKIWAEARPKPDQPECYEIELTRLFVQPGGEPASRETTRLAIDLRTLAVTGGLPSVGLEELVLGGPAELGRWLDGCGLRGYLRADGIEYRPGEVATVLLTVREGVLSLPMNAAERSVAAGERFFRLENVEGTVRVSSGKAEVALAGRLRSRPVTLKGTLILGKQGSQGKNGDRHGVSGAVSAPAGLRLSSDTPASVASSEPVPVFASVTQPAGGEPDVEQGGLGAVGFDLELGLTDFQLPRGDAEDAAERRLVTSWPVVAEQVSDFDGEGPVDVTIRLRREPRADAEVEFVEGAVDFKGCSARYVSFPYRLFELAGRVWIRPDGRVELQNIVGRHGAARVTVEGLLGGRVSNEGDLRVGGEDIALDEDLLVCLDERDRELIRRFRATVRADVQVRMRRPATPPDERPGRWRTEIDIGFADGTIDMVDFPYPFERLSGRLRIADGRMEVSQLCGRRGDARVCVEGTAEDAGERGFGFDMQLTATDVVVDEVLGRALPGEGKKIYEQFRPTGKVEVSGRLFTPEPGAAVACDLTAIMKDGLLAISGSGERLGDCRGRLRIRPERLTVESLAGKFGQATVEVEGSVPLRAGEPGMALRVWSERVELDERLRSALPAGARAVWDEFEPAGVAGFEVRYGQGGADYTVVIEPIDCRARYREFPVPLSKISGRLVVSPGRVLIERLKAEHEGATIESVGVVEVGDARTLIVLTLDARNLGFTPALREALPWRLRRLWNDVKPAGRADLTFDKLMLTRPADGMVTWTFEGSAKLHDASLKVGPQLTEVQGEIRASGEVGEEFAFSGDLAWSQARVEGWKVTDLRADFSRPRGTGRLSVNQLMGQFYGGKVIGEVEMQDSPRGTEYGLTLTARDVMLGDFLNAKPRPGEKSLDLKGVVDGNLSLAGKFGDVGSRHGGGTVFIHHAQMMKVPFVLAMMQVVHLVVDDDNAFQDARLSFRVDEDDLLFQEIDLRGKAMSMVGAGRVKTPTEMLDLVLLVGSPLRLPRIEVLSEILEGFARELAEVHVEGRLGEPRFRAEVVRSLRKTVDTILGAREKRRR